jgi:hypothetical protein
MRPFQVDQTSIRAARGSPHVPSTSHLPEAKLIAVIGRVLAGLSILSLALVVAGGDPFVAVSAAVCFSVVVVCMAGTRSFQTSRVGRLTEPRLVPALVRGVTWSPPGGDGPVILTVIRR